MCHREQLLRGCALVPAAGAGAAQYINSCLDRRFIGCGGVLEGVCREAPAMMMDAGAADNQTVAAFLIARPPIGYLGWGWVRPP